MKNVRTGSFAIALGAALLVYNRSRVAMSAYSQHTSGMVTMLALIVLFGGIIFVVLSLVRRK